ncbi:hypothetical protein, partial [Solemya elarraichensis gill symbiont]
PFQREYDERWTRELFVINHRFTSEGIPQYKLKDYSGEVIIGTFYENQLIRAHDRELYAIEKIL